MVATIKVPTLVFQLP